jgi:4-amino-4-deoxy-L-arabinose transferase-like glycosyltransferase
MEEEPRTTKILAGLLALFCLFALLYRLGSAALFEPDEGRNAEIAREILVLQNWTTPHYNFVPRLDKPIFFYWLIALSYKIFGVSEWSARLPSVIAALGCVATTFLWAKGILGTWQALWAGLILATSVEFMILARTVIVDMPLNFLMTLSLASFFAGTRVERRSMKRLLFLLMFAALGFATVLKGPVGILLPALVMGSYIACSRQWFLGREMNPLSGWFVFLSIVVPACVWTEMHNHGFLRYFLLEENLGRFLSARFNRQQPTYYYLLVLTVGFLPWSLLLFGGAKFWRKKITDERILFLVLWILVPLAFYTLSRSKQPAYILSAFPPAAILSAEFLVDLIKDRSAEGRLMLAGPWLLLAGMILALIPGPQWANVLTSAANSHFARILYSISLTHLITLWAGFALLAWMSWKTLWRKPEAFYVSYCAGMVLFVAFWQQVVSGVSVARSSKDLAEESAMVVDSNHPIVMYGANLSSLPFYLQAQHPVWIVTSRKRTIMGSAYVAGRLAKHDDQLKKIVFTPEEFSRLPDGVKRKLWIFTPDRDLPRLRALGVIDTIRDGQAIRLVRFR